MRAQLAIAAAGMRITQIEVSSRDKPAAMRALSPKGTVPVLHLPDGTVVDESLDVMRWALAISDPQGWLHADEITTLVAENDGAFKLALDRYKYAPRLPEHPASHYRDEAAHFLQKLEVRLAVWRYLQGDTPHLTDAAIFPFVRQFAGVDPAWFAVSPYRALERWLNDWLASALFAEVMKK
jgi:glutathione S-transferase